MGQKVPPGLRKRGEIWYIWKTIGSHRIRESTGTSILAEAERYLAHRIEEVRKAEICGVRPKRTFREAATKYLNEATKVTIREDADHVRRLDPFIGDLQLENVHMGTLQPFIEHRKAQGVKHRTVNYALQVVRHMLNLAASEWLDQHGMTWLRHAPKIKLLPENDRRAPYPMSWEEQDRLFNELPDHLKKMALFKVNTGCRESEVCSLRWEWEVPIPELNTSVFIIPADRVKNRQDRLVVLNSVAKEVIEGVRGTHPIHVFTYKGHPVGKMYTTSWKKARERAELPQVRVHDLKHTFGRRLRSAGVSFEDRQDLLGHKSERITTHYSGPELINLIEASERVCRNDWHKSGTIVILKKKTARLAIAN
jgi:integrase